MLWDKPAPAQPTMSQCNSASSCSQADPESPHPGWNLAVRVTRGQGGRVRSKIWLGGRQGRPAQGRCLTKGLRPRKGAWATLKQTVTHAVLRVSVRLLRSLYGETTCLRLRRGSLN